MFEKYAEEICSKYFEENCHKKNKWADTKDLVTMWQDGYNKANEWHYVKDGDLPKTHGWYFVQYNNDTFDCAIVTKDLRFLNFYTDKDMTEAVYAWKEIVLPKESE